MHYSQYAMKYLIHHFDMDQLLDSETVSTVDLKIKLNKENIFINWDLVFIASTYASIFIISRQLSSQSRSAVGEYGIESFPCTSHYKRVTLHPTILEWEHRAWQGIDKAFNDEI